MKHCLGNWCCCCFSLYYVDLVHIIKLFVCFISVWLEQWFYDSIDINRTDVKVIGVDCIEANLSSVQTLQFQSSIAKQLFV